MTAKIVTIFGGDGFVGRYVVQQLLRDGAQVRVASRNPKRGYFLKAQANLGQISWVVADVANEASVARAVAGADAVINLAGAFSDMDRVQHQGARIVAEAAKKAKVSALVNMSAIGADAESASLYGRSKGEGEVAVRKAFPNAAIVRPSIIFGREDQFINRFAGLIQTLPVVPVVKADAKFQPVYVGDVARAIVAGLSQQGGVIELGGPKVMTMREIFEWIAKSTGRSPIMLDIPDPISAAMARLTGFLPAAPMTWDQWLMLQKDNVVVEGANGLEMLGIAPTPLDAVAPDWMVLYRKHGRFGEKASA